MPTDLPVYLLDLMMRHNIFEFNGELYRQLSGVDMGTRAGPSLANIFCAEIDEEIVKLAETYYKTRQWTPTTCPLPLLLPLQDAQEARTRVGTAREQRD